MRTLNYLLAVLTAAAGLSNQHGLAASEPAAYPIEPQVRDEDGLIIFQVSGAFRPTQSAAKINTLQAAQQQMRWWLERQESPIQHAPSIETIRQKLITQEDVPIVETVEGTKMYKITISVFLDPATMRELRATDRVVSCVWWLGSLMGILAVGALAIRMDEWTKGYLTRWIVAGAVGLVLAVGLLVRWAR